MSDAPNFNSLLDRDSSEVERPPLLPQGTYVATVSKVPEMSTIADDRFDVVDFPMKIVSATDDVDEDALEEFGTVAGQPIRHRFMFSREEGNEANFRQTEYNLTRFLTEHLGLADAKLRELLSNSVGARCLIQVKWRQDKNDPEIFYAQIARTAPEE